ncbi:TPA: ribonuclease Z, partial [Enterococcus faecium]|nr:ribonuclease Z [Enterococcus faecium]
HLHGDHIFGLPGLISSRSFQGGDTPLEIYGPKGIEEYIKVSLGISQTRLSYPLKFIELNETAPIFTDQQFSVYTKKLNHGIDSFGYRVVEHDHKGELQVDRLKELGIPAGPLYGKLKQGETIQLEDGRTINGKDFVGPDKKGRIVTILGDTRKTHNSVVLAENSDILVHESTFNKDEARMAHNYFHSTTHQAAEVAKEAQAKRLLLTHISARYLGKAALELEKEAQEVFENTTIMKDFDSIEIPFREEEEA